MTLPIEPEAQALLSGYRTFLRAEQAREAFDVLLDSARADHRYQFVPHDQGMLERTVRYKVGKDRPYGFIVNAADLLFYYRLPSRRVDDGTLQSLQAQGLEVARANTGEIKIRIRTPADAVAVVRDCFGYDGLPRAENHAEEVPDEQGFNEGAVMRVTVNRYERSRDARALCLAHFGHRCLVCGFDFEVAYGLRGRGYIHVHHVRDLASIGEDYVIDPVKDLIPVCPNCHAMLHTERPAMIAADLRATMPTACKRLPDRT